MSTFGPAELVVIAFEENRFNGDIVPALAELVDTGIIRLIDVVFVTKDAEGDITAIELTDIEEAVRGAFEPLIEDLSGLVSDEDTEDLAEALEPNQSAAILLFEHTWATRFADAVADSGGEFVVVRHIPRDAIHEAIAASAGA